MGWIDDLAAPYAPKPEPTAEQRAASEDAFFSSRRSSDVASNTAWKFEDTTEPTVVETEETTLWWSI